MIAALLHHWLEFIILGVLLYALIKGKNARWGD